MSNWEVIPFDEPYRYPWIVIHHGGDRDRVFGIGEAIIAFPTREDAQEKADELNARHPVRICGWCGDELEPGAKAKALKGWPTTHGICGPCEAKVTTEIDGRTR